jgi:hypothetical protein
MLALLAIAWWRFRPKVFFLKLQGETLMNKMVVKYLN